MKNVDQFEIEKKQVFRLKRDWWKVIAGLFLLLVLLRAGLGPLLLKILIPMNGLEDLVWLVIILIVIFRAGFSLSDIWRYGNKWRDRQLQLKVSIQPKLTFVKMYPLPEIRERMSLIEFAIMTDDSLTSKKGPFDDLKLTFAETHEMWVKLQNRLPTRTDWEKTIPIKFHRIIRTIEGLWRQFTWLNIMIDTLENDIGEKTLSDARKKFEDVNSEDWGR